MCTVLHRGQLLVLVYVHVKSKPRRKLTRKITCSFGAGDLNHQQAADLQASELVHGPAHSLQPAVDDDLIDQLIDPSVEPVKSDTSQTMILSDGSLTTFAVPADDEDPDEVRPFFLLCSQRLVSLVSPCM